MEKYEVEAKNAAREIIEAAGLKKAHSQYPRLQRQLLQLLKRSLIKGEFTLLHSAVNI